MESENVLLRESLSNTKDKLAEATSQINRFSEELIGNKVTIEEYIGSNVEKYFFMYKQFTASF